MSMLVWGHRARIPFPPIPPPSLYCKKENCPYFRDKDKGVKWAHKEKICYFPLPAMRGFFVSLKSKFPDLMCTKVQIKRAKSVSWLVPGSHSKQPEGSLLSKGPDPAPAVLHGCLELEPNWRMISLSFDMPIIPWDSISLGNSGGNKEAKSTKESVSLNQIPLVSTQWKLDFHKYVLFI